MLIEYHCDLVHPTEHRAAYPIQFLRHFALTDQPNLLYLHLVNNLITLLMWQQYQV